MCWGTRRAAAPDMLHTCVPAGTKSEAMTVTYGNVDGCRIRSVRSVRVCMMGAHANRCEEILLFGDSSVTSPQRHLDSSNLSAVSFHQNVDSPVPTPPTWLRVRAFHCVHLGEGAFHDRDRFHCYDLRTGGRGRAGVSLSSLAPVLCRTVGPSIDRVLSSLSLSLR